MNSREQHQVELVDPSGQPVGVCSVAEAHRLPGQLHRAFSVLLVDAEGRTLLQQRAATKTRFPLRWANSCCGHPAPGQSVVAAANQRLREELGVGPVELTEVGVYTYRAEDPATGRVEVEYDHVLRGKFSALEPLAADPAEVHDLRWITPAEAAAEARRDPGAYAPWLAGVLDQLLTHSGTTGSPHASERSGGR